MFPMMTETKLRLKKVWSQPRHKPAEHKYGNCPRCGVGLDDRADFVVYTPYPNFSIFVCDACYHQLS
jgi:hypothetical protein